MKHKGLVIIAILVAAAIGAGSIYLLTRPEIYFDTMEPSIESGAEFKPLSLVTGVKNAKIEDVTVTGTAGILKPGEYHYIYTVKSKSYDIVLKVVDTTAPALTARENLSFTDWDEIKAEDLVTAEDEGIVTLSIGDAFDNKKLGTQEVIVKATDDSGNTSEITISVNIEAYDTKAPEIKGAGNVTITLGSSFDVKSGVEVTDDKDKNPSLEINSAALNTNAAGKYTITYIAKDEYGNETKVDRVITVVKYVSYTPGNDPSVSWNAAGVEGQPYLVTVNRTLCTATVYGKDSNGDYTVPVRAMLCSVGKNNGMDQTPCGRFKTNNRVEWCYMVDGSWGRYAIYIDTSSAHYPDGTACWGIMFHSVCYYNNGDIKSLEYDEWNKLGNPASLGCIRLCVGDELWLYQNCPYGFEVIVYEDSTSPGPLGKPVLEKIDTSDSEKRGWDPTDPMYPF